MVLVLAARVPPDDVEKHVNGACTGDVCRCHVDVGDGGIAGVCKRV